MPMSASGPRAEGARHEDRSEKRQLVSLHSAGSGIRNQAPEEVIESGGKIVQETRLYNAGEGKTYGMRSKEQAHDYRYFPEPDLLPLVVDETWRSRSSPSFLNCPRPGGRGW